MEKCREEQTHMSVQGAEHMQEAEPGSNWLLEVCTLEAAEHNVLMLRSSRQSGDTLHNNHIRQQDKPITTTTVPCRLRVAGIDPLRFLAGWRTRQLN